ncbi:MAG: AsmA family protein, partial [Pseudodesulfovibrio sp.]|nr:AsmA family protein [Pseudodesulfovibrio sp.]
KAVKLSMIVIGIVIAVFVAALIVFVSTFDLNAYKDRITNAVLDQTGRTLHFDGELELTLFPRLGVTLGGMSLANVESFGPKPMVQVVSARVFVRVLPLLRGNIRFGHMELDGLTLNLSRAEDGETNWDDLVGRIENGEKTESISEKKSHFSLEIEGVDITNANLMWDDRKGDSKFFLRGASLTTGEIYKGAPFPVDAKLDFECTKPNVRGSLTLVGNSSIDLETRQYGYMDMKLSISAEGADIPGGKGNAEMALQSMALDFNKGYAQITGFTVSSYGATAHLDGSIEGLTKDLQKMAATVTIDSFDAKKTLVALGEDAPVTLDPAALTQVGGMLDFVYTPGQIQVKKLQADLDGTRVVGNGHVKKGEEEPSYFVRLDVGNLDLDRYMPPALKENTEMSKEAVASGGKSDRLMDSRVLRRLSLDLEAMVAELKVDGLRMQNVKCQVKARHGLIRISPVSANSYGGTISAGMTINALSKYPKTDLILGVDKINIGLLSQDVLGEDSYEGIANFNSAISCEGERVSGMLRSMNGKVGFNLSDGVFPGVDLIRMVKNTHKSKGAQKGTVEAAKTDSTAFGSISGTGVITGGILRNRDLEVKAPGLRATGQGAVVLPTRQIDYLLKVKLTPTFKGQGGQSSDDLYGVMVPIRISGNLDNPRYWVSVSEYVKALGGAVIGTAGAVLGGVKDAIKGVGSAINGSCCEDNGTKKEAPEKRKRFLGIF